MKRWARLRQWLPATRHTHHPLHASSHWLVARLERELPRVLLCHVLMCLCGFVMWWRQHTQHPLWMTIDMIVTMVVMGGMWHYLYPLEWLNWCVTWRRHRPLFVRTGIPIPRRISSWFRFKVWGLPIWFTFESVQVLVYHNHFVLVGRREPNRRREWVFDVGASGYKSYGQSVRGAAVAELQQELGIVVTPDDLTPFCGGFPAQGFCCISHVFKLKRNVTETFVSTDGTFDRIVWVSQKEMVEELYSLLPNRMPLHIQWLNINTQCLIDKGLLRYLARPSRTKKNPP